MNDYKGAGQLLDIARELNGSKQVKLHIVGHIQDDATRFKKVGIEIPADPDRPLTEEEFEKEWPDLTTSFCYIPPTPTGS